MSFNIKVQGSLLLSFAQTCIDLKYLLNFDLRTAVLQTVTNPKGWYSFDLLYNICQLIEKTHKKPKQVLQNIGQEMMKTWYFQAGGKEKVKTGIDFLHFQSGSEGYYSVVKGPRNEVGEFKLINISHEKGIAQLTSTTPLPTYLERGVIIGGMSAPGDLKEIKIKNKNKITFDFKKFKFKQKNSFIVYFT